MHGRSNISNLNMSSNTATGAGTNSNVRHHAASTRNKPVILVEGKVRQECEKKEHEIFELRRQIAE